MRKILVFASLFFSALAAASTNATENATDYPSRPVKFIVPFTAGTGMDRIARLVGHKFQERLGQPVVVENRTGVAGHLGAELVARAPADGYTILVTARDITITAALYPSDNFDPKADLQPVCIAAWGGTMLVANAEVDIDSLDELIAQAKAAPGKLSFASGGVGSSSHLALEQFQEATGTKFLHVPYKGTAPAINDVIGGRVSLGFGATHTVMPQVEAGRLKAVATVGAKRHRLAPDIQAFGEVKEMSGSASATEAGAWYGFLAPADTPPELVAKIGAEIREILNMPDVKTNLEHAGLDVRPSTSEEMAKVMSNEYANYAAIVKKYNITPN